MYLGLVTLSLMLVAAPIRPSPTAISDRPRPNVFVQPAPQPLLAPDPGGPAPPPPWARRISIGYHCPWMTGIARVEVGRNHSTPLLLTPPVSRAPLKLMYTRS